jgi:hypothetical protein
MLKGYTTRQQIENYLLITVDASFYTQVNSWIEQIEKYIDQTTGRNFIADTVASRKYYDGDGTNELLTDDFIELTKLEIDEVEIDDESGLYANYILYPLNTECKNKIKLRYDNFTKEMQNIYVTAKWGYSAAVPADIMIAATVFVAGILNYSCPQKGNLKSLTVGQYSVTYKDEQGWQDFARAKDILESYKKYSFV